MALPTASVPQHRSRARGGTLLGFLLGLLVGIGASLAVAVYVTKVPIPLVDRGVQRKPTQPETESQRLQQWNPNAGLSSARSSAPPAAPAEGTAADAAPSGAPAPDPIAELIQQRTGSAPVAAPVPSTPARSAAADAAPKPASPAASGDASDPFLYFVQVGAFRNAEEAEAQRARLALQGFDARISEREQNGQRVWRVRLGPFDSQTQAEAMQERLRGARFETALVRVQR